MSQWGFSDNHSHCTMKIILFQMIAKKIIYTSPIFLSYIGWFFHFMQHIWHSIKNWKQFLEQEEKSTLKWLLLEQIIVHCAFSSWEISSRKFSHQLKIWRVTSKMICEKNTVHSMSKLCLEAWASKSNETENCFPNYTHDTIGNIYGIWWMINVFIGFIGNLLTLLAIPYCAIKKK